MLAEALQRRPDLSQEFRENRTEKVIKGKYNGPYLVAGNGKKLLVPILVNADTPEGVRRGVEMPRTVKDWEIGDVYRLRYEVTKEKVGHMLRIIGGRADNKDHMHIARALVGDAPQSAFYFAMGNDEVARDRDGNMLPKTTALFIVQNDRIAQPLRNGTVEITEKIVSKGNTSLTVAHKEIQEGRVVKEGDSVLSFQRYPYEPKPAPESAPASTNSKAKIIFRQEPDYSGYVPCGGSVSTSEEEVRVFGWEISGDLNPVHRDKDYAAKTFFGKRIAYGLSGVGKALVTSLDYAREMGAKGKIESYMVNFKSPVVIGETGFITGVLMPERGGNVYNFVSLNGESNPVMTGSFTLG